MALELLLHYGLAEVAALLALRCAIRGLARSCLPGAWYDPGEGAFIAAFFSFLCYRVTLALDKGFYEPGNSDLRCLQVSDELFLCLRLYFASNIADMPFLLGDAYSGLRSPKDVAIMTLHHVLSATCFWGGIYTRKMLFHATYALVCEYTTVLVGLRRLLLPFKSNARVSAALSLLDLVIMAFYFRFRIYLFAMWFYYAWLDGACLRFSQNGLERGLQMFYTPVIFFLLCISVWWLRTMLSKSGARLTKAASHHVLGQVPGAAGFKANGGKAE